MSDSLPGTEGTEGVLAPKAPKASTQKVLIHMCTHTRTHVQACVQARMRTATSADKEVGTHSQEGINPGTEMYSQIRNRQESIQKKTP